jgi:hypothetical protein
LQDVGDFLKPADDIWYVLNHMRRDYPIEASRAA